MQVGMPGVPTLRTNGPVLGSGGQDCFQIGDASEVAADRQAARQGGGAFGNSTGSGMFS